MRVNLNRQVKDSPYRKIRGLYHNFWQEILTGKQAGKREKKGGGGKEKGMGGHGEADKYDYLWPTLQDHETTLFKKEEKEDLKTKQQTERLRFINSKNWELKVLWVKREIKKRKKKKGLAETS